MLFIGFFWTLNISITFFCKTNIYFSKFYVGGLENLNKSNLISVE